MSEGKQKCNKISENFQPESGTDSEGKVQWSECLCSPTIIRWNANP